MINISRILTGVIALGTLTAGTVAITMSEAKADTATTDTIALSSLAITEPLWVTDPYSATDPLWLTQRAFSAAIDWEHTDLIVVVSQDQRLPRGAEVVYRDRAGTTVAELDAQRGRTLITIVQCNDGFDDALDSMRVGAVDAQESVVVINPDSMHPVTMDGRRATSQRTYPNTGRSGSNPTPHP